VNSRLERLLDPVTLETFFNTYWARRSCIAKRTPPAWPADSGSTFDRLLQSGLLPAGFVSVVDRGNSVGAEKWSATRTAGSGDARVALPERLLNLYKSGATIILNEVDASSPEVGECAATWRAN